MCIKLVRDLYENVSMNFLVLLSQSRDLTHVFYHHHGGPSHSPGCVHHGHVD